MELIYIPEERIDSKILQKIQSQKEALSDVEKAQLLYVEKK